MKVKLREVISEFIVPMRDKPKEFSGNVPWCRIEDIDGKYLLGTKSDRYVSEETIESMNLKKIPRNSVICSCSATIGVTAITKAELCTNQTFIGLVPSEKIVSDYLYYYLSLCKERLVKIASITTIPYISRDQFERFEISYFNIDTQKKIAHILSLLDSKIELCNEIISKLELMWKTIFNYWFVQFDFPNYDGKPYKTNDGEIVDNVVYKNGIPVGWEIQKLGKVLKTLLGGTPSKRNKEYWNNGSIPWLSSGEICQFPVIKSNNFITSTGLENSAAKLLPKGSVIISLVRYIRPSILAVDACTNQSVVGVLESESLKNLFLYPYLQNEIPRLMIKRSGAQQPHINKGSIDKINLLIPPSDILDEYYKLVKPIFEEIVIIARMNKQLAEFRDWLLPMLMNGQIIVSEQKQ